MKLRYKLVFVLFWLAYNGFAQQWKAYFLDENGRLMQKFIGISIKDSTGQHLTYTLTKKGIYNYIIPKGLHKFYVRCWTSGYNTVEDTVIVSGNQQVIVRKYYFYPIPVEELPEVVVKAQPVYTDKDTVNYRISHFTNGTERKLKDILVKLPGITVNEQTGIIKYHGKEIKSLLINGENIFDRHYGIATKYLDAALVKKIQAIKHYHKNKILAAFEQNNNVALNVLLKKKKIIWNGQAEIAGGKSADNKPKGKGIINLLSFAKHFKTFGVFGMNNIGKNLAVTDRNTKNPALNLPGFNMYDNFITDLADRFSLYNRQAYGGLHFYLQPDSLSGLKFHFNGLTDRLKQQILYERQWTVDNFAWRTKEENRFSPLETGLSFHYERSDDKKFYLEISGESQFVNNHYYSKTLSNSENKVNDALSKMKGANLNARLVLKKPEGAIWDTKISGNTYVFSQQDSWNQYRQQYQYSPSTIRISEHFYPGNNGIIKAYGTGFNYIYWPLQTHQTDSLSFAERDIYIEKSAFVSGILIFGSGKSQWMWRNVLWFYHFQRGLTGQKTTKWFPETMLQWTLKKDSPDEKQFRLGISPKTFNRRYLWTRPWQTGFFSRFYYEPSFSLDWDAYFDADGILNITEDIDLDYSLSYHFIKNTFLRTFRHEGDMMYNFQKAEPHYTRQWGIELEWDKFIYPLHTKFYLGTSYWGMLQPYENSEGHIKTSRLNDLEVNGKIISALRGPYGFSCYFTYDIFLTNGISNPGWHIIPSIYYVIRNWKMSFRYKLFFPEGSGIYYDFGEFHLGSMYKKPWKITLDVYNIFNKQKEIHKDADNFSVFYEEKYFVPRIIMAGISYQW